MTLRPLWFSRRKEFPVIDQKTAEAALKVATQRVLADDAWRGKIRKLDGISIITSSLQVSTQVEFMTDTHTFVINTNARMTSAQLIGALAYELTHLLLDNHPNKLEVAMDIAVNPVPIK